MCNSRLNEILPVTYRVEGELPARKVIERELNLALKGAGNEVVGIIASALDTVERAALRPGDVITLSYGKAPYGERPNSQRPLLMTVTRECFLPR
jgi:hypothetical protein